MIARAELEFIDSAAPGGKPLGPVTLPSGATAWMVVREQEIPGDVLADINRKRAVRVTREGERQPGIRLFLFGLDDLSVGYIREVPALEGE